MKTIELKVLATVISTLFISVFLAFNYIYFSHTPPAYSDFFISLFGYGLYVFTLFIIGACLSFILDYKFKNKFNNFVSYIFSGGVIGLLFCLIAFRGNYIKDLIQMALFGMICACLFWLIQQICKRLFFRIVIIKDKSS